MRDGYGWIPVHELETAVEAGFLTKEEARLVIWSALPALQSAAASTPPAIETAAA